MAISKEEAQAILSQLQGDEQVVQQSMMPEMSISKEEAAALLSQMKEREKNVNESLTPEQAQEILGHSLPEAHMAAIPEAPEGKFDPQDQVSHEYLQAIGSAYAGYQGAKKGLTEFLLGGGKLGAKAIDYMFGTQLHDKVPDYTPDTMQQVFMEQYPKSSGIGEFIGGSLPLLALPEAAAGKIASLEPYIEGLPKALQGITGFGGRVAKGAAVGAPIGAIYSPDEPLSESMALGAITGGLGSAAEPVLQKGLQKGTGLGTEVLKNVFGGTSTPRQVKRMMDAAKRQDVKLPLGEAIESPMLKKFQGSFLENLPFSGMSRQYKQAGKGLTKQLESALKEIAPESDKQIGKITQNALKEASTAAEKKNKSLYNQVERIADNTDSVVIPKNYAKTAEKELTKITKYAKENPEIKDVFNPDIYKTLKLASEKKPISYGAAFDLDRKLNNQISQAKVAGDVPTNSLLSSIKTALNKDINTSAQSSNNQALAKKWREAKKHFQESVVPLRTKEITNIIKPNADLDTVTQTFVKTGQYERPTQLKKITKHLTQEEKGNLAHSYLTKSDINIPGQELSDADKALTAYGKLGPQQKEQLFTKEQKKKLDDILMLRKAYGGDLQQMQQLKTGEKVARGAGFAGALALGKSYGAPALLKALAGGQLAKQALMSDLAKTAYMKSQRLKQPQINFGRGLGRGQYLGLPFLGNNE